jgi:hypothetical protein
MLILLLLTLIRPNVAHTPGLTRQLSQREVCSTKWGLDHRHVTEKMKRQVAAAYGVPWADRHRYEFDHYIPRELGGADDVSNLWPEPLTGLHNAHDKDRLENALHRKVCAGDMTLGFAVEAIQADWISAFRLYVQP